MEVITLSQSWEVIRAWFSLFSNVFDYLLNMIFDFILAILLCSIYSIYFLAL